MKKKLPTYQPVSKILLHLPPPRQKGNSLSLHKAKVRGSQTYFLLCLFLNLLPAFCFLFSNRVLSTWLTFASAGILCRFAIALAGSKMRLAFRFAAMIGSFGASLFFSFIFSHFLQNLFCIFVLLIDCWPRLASFILKSFQPLQVTFCTAVQGVKRWEKCSHYAEEWDISTSYGCSSFWATGLISRLQAFIRDLLGDKDGQSMFENVDDPPSTLSQPGWSAKLNSQTNESRNIWYIWYMNNHRNQKSIFGRTCERKRSEKVW